MPTLDALEYDRFSYDEPTGGPLALDEAVKTAASLRKADSEHFYRIEAADASGTSFRVVKVSVASVYAELLTRFSRRFARRVRAKA